MNERLPVPIGGTSLVDQAALEEALRSARGYADAALSAGTMRAYASDWRQFEGWCERADLAVLPAAIGTVAAYLASLADSGLRVSTIDRRVAAIRWRHRCAGHPSPTDAEPIKAELRGIRRTLGSRVDQKAPITDRELKAMLKRIPDDLGGKRDRAVLLLCFAAALRRSELVALTVADLERVPEGLFVHIRASKTDQQGAGDVVAVPHGAKLGVVAAVDGWLRAAGITAGPVFRAVGQGGRLAVDALSDQSVALIVKARAAAAGFDPTRFSGHSLRAGLVTTALLKGAEAFRVMDITRHKKVDTLRIYDRRAKAFQAHAGAKFL